MEFELTVRKMADIACDYQKEILETGEVGKLCMAIEYAAQKELFKWLREHDNCAVMYESRAFTLTLKDWRTLIRHFELEGE